MPAQVTMSELVAKTSQQTVAEASAKVREPIRTGLQNLPPGILNGIAELAEIGFFKMEGDTQAKRFDGTSAAGEIYFRAAGVAKFPESLPMPDGTTSRVEGLQTSEIWPFYDTKRGGKLFTQAEATLRIMNCVKALANNVDFFVPFAAANGNKIDAQVLFQAVAALKGARIGQGKKPLYFRFQTRAGRATPQYPNPRTFEEWKGSAGLENWQPKSPLAATQDSNVAAPPATDPTPEQLGDVIEASASTDVAALLRSANSGATDQEKSDAQKRLIALAVAAGHTSEAANAARSWDDVAAMAKEPPAKPAAAPSLNGAAAGPKVTEVWRYTKAPKLDAQRNVVAGQYRTVDATVTAANADGTFELTNLDNGTPYPKVPLADLQPA